MTEISIYPFVGGFLINLTWVNGFKLHLTVLKVSYMHLAYPKTYSLVLELLKSAQG